MIVYIILSLVLSFSVVSDLKLSKIPNILVFPASISGLAINTWYSGFAGLKHSLAGMVLPIIILGVFFYVRLLGAGDIKLLSAIGSIIGWKLILDSIACTFIIAGFIALAALIKTSKVKSTFLTFLKDIKMSFFLSNAINFPHINNRHCIKLSPYIAISVGLQVIFHLY